MIMSNICTMQMFTILYESLVIRIIVVAHKTTSCRLRAQCRPWRLTLGNRVLNFGWIWETRFEMWDGCVGEAQLTPKEWFGHGVMGGSCDQAGMMHFKWCCTLFLFLCCSETWVIFWEKNFNASFLCCSETWVYFQNKGFINKNAAIYAVC